MLLAVIGTGVTLTALIMSQKSGLRREVRDEIGTLRRETSDLRDEMHREMGALRERMARIEGVLEMVWMGMRMPPLADDAEETRSA